MSDDHKSNGGLDPNFAFIFQEQLTSFNQTMTKGFRDVNEAVNQSDRNNDARYADLQIKIQATQVHCDKKAKQEAKDSIADHEGRRHLSLGKAAKWVTVIGGATSAIYGLVKFIQYLQA